MKHRPFYSPQLKRTARLEIRHDRAVQLSRWLDNHTPFAHSGAARSNFILIGDKKEPRLPQAGSFASPTNEDRRQVPAKQTKNRRTRVTRAIRMML
jgi:hypothetical protein